MNVPIAPADISRLPKAAKSNDGAETLNVGNRCFAAWGPRVCHGQEQNNGTSFLRLFILKTVIG